MSGTGIVKDDLFIEHDTGAWHPESPDRLKSIYNSLERRDRPELTIMERRFATQEDICLVHTSDHFKRIAKTEGQEPIALDADTHVCGRSFPAALAAAGGVIQLTEQVLDGHLTNGFALIRPPGHHAEAGRAMGFCLFNNVAVGAAWAMKNRGLSRILIVDWDLHHGNGTQHAFYTDNRVVYFSTHQFPYYPGTGALAETGRDKGLGYTINVPFNYGFGDEHYLAVFKRILVPVSIAFKPELIMVSAGFDIYKNDPLGGMRVTTEGFAALTRVLKAIAEELCQGRLVFTLEGGYHIDGLAEGTEKVLGVLSNTCLAGKELVSVDPPEPEIVGSVRRMHSDFWSF